MLLRGHELSGLVLYIFMLVFDEIVESTHGLWAEHNVFGLRWRRFKPAGYSIEFSFIVDLNLILSFPFSILLVFFLILKPFISVLSCPLVVMVVRVRAELFLHRLFDDLSSFFNRWLSFDEGIFGAWRLYGRRCLEIVVGEVDCDMGDCLSILWHYFYLGFFAGRKRVAGWKFAYWLCLYLFSYMFLRLYLVLLMDIIIVWGLNKLGLNLLCDKSAHLHLLELILMLCLW